MSKIVLAEDAPWWMKYDAALENDDQEEADRLLDQMARSRQTWPWPVPKAMCRKSCGKCVQCRFCMIEDAVFDYQLGEAEKMHRRKGAGPQSIYPPRDARLNSRGSP